MLVKRQNAFVSETTREDKESLPRVPLNCVTTSMLLGDGSTSNFDRLLQLYALNAAETTANRGVSFMLDRLLHSVRVLNDSNACALLVVCYLCALGVQVEDLVTKPLLESAEQSISRVFSFKSVDNGPQGPSIESRSSLDARLLLCKESLPASFTMADAISVCAVCSFMYTRAV